MGKRLKGLIAQSKSQVGEKFIDFFSIGHIVLGFVVFGLSFLFLRFSLGVVFLISKIISIIVVSYTALGWEFLENFTTIGEKLKFSKKRDALINSLSDILFTSFGSILAYFLLTWYFLGLLLLIILLVVGRYINF